MQVNQEIWIRTWIRIWIRIPWMDHFVVLSGDCLYLQRTWAHFDDNWRWRQESPALATKLWATVADSSRLEYKPGFRNKLQWNLNRNSNIFIQENAFESVVCETASILSWPQWVKIDFLKTIQHVVVKSDWFLSRGWGLDLVTAIW